MADKEISALTAGTALAGTEVFHGQQGGNSRKFTATQMNAAVGASFPGSPATNSRFYRTDRGIDYFYDGTQWLSTQLFILPIATQANLNPLTAVTDFLQANPHWNEYDIYVVRGTVVSYNTATTATNYFTYQFKYRDGASFTNLGGSMSAQNDTQNEMVGHSVTPNTVVTSAIEDFQIAWTETGAANTYISGVLQYRLVG